MLYVIIDTAYQELSLGVNSKRKHAPKGRAEFSDSEVITITIFGEMVFKGAEDKTLHFIRQYHLDLFPRLLSNSRFNRRKHHLVTEMEAIRCQLRDAWHKRHPLAEEDVALRLVDSAPIELCTYTRANRCRTIPAEWRQEWFGVCSSKKSKFFGARCHATTTLDQMIDTWLLAPGSYEDRKPLIALLEAQEGLKVIGDKGYVSAELEERLWEAGQHLLLCLKRDNQHQQWPGRVQQILGYLRHRIETAFSVLATVFSFEKPGSRSFSGFIARSATKILAHTVSFFLADFFTPDLSN